MKCAILYVWTVTPSTLQSALTVDFHTQSAVFNVPTDTQATPGEYKVTVTATTVGKGADQSPIAIGTFSQEAQPVLLADPDCEVNRSPGPGPIKGADKSKETKEERPIRLSEASKAEAEAGLEIDLNTSASVTPAFVTTPAKCAQWLQYVYVTDPTDKTYADAPWYSLISRDGLKFTFASTKDTKVPSIMSPTIVVQAHSLLNSMRADYVLNYKWVNPCDPSKITFDTTPLLPYVLGKTAYGKLDFSSRVTATDPAWCTEILISPPMIDITDSEWGEKLSLIANLKSFETDGYIQVPYSDTAADAGEKTMTLTYLFKDMDRAFKPNE